MLFRQYHLPGSSRRRFGQRLQLDNHFPDPLWVAEPLRPLGLAVACMPLLSPFAQCLVHHGQVLATKQEMARESDRFVEDPVQLGEGVECSVKLGMLRIFQQLAQTVVFGAFKNLEREPPTTPAAHQITSSPNQRPSTFAPEPLWNGQ
jgi:hypothetical protein